MMNLTLDIGNTMVKWALFEGGCLTRSGRQATLEGVPHAERAMVCASGRVDEAALAALADEVHILSAETSLPIGVDYETPQTLGADRVAAACGARRLGEGRACVVVDAGTCITIDYIDAAGVYRGGAILPGMEMKFRALHTFTAKLPLLSDVGFDEAPLTGRSTRASMAAGVLTATRFEVEGFVARYRAEAPECDVLLTGGDAERLWGEGRLAVAGCRIEPQLVMVGLNEILDRLEDKEIGR
ncbi:MAG: type III pantothenate kinase [Bacteroidales bacterium]|nr:type III pantothenate kinase [Bacteroidales bacterium]